MFIEVEPATPPAVEESYIVGVSLRPPHVCMSMVLKGLGSRVQGSKMPIPTCRRRSIFV